MAENTVDAFYVGDDFCCVETNVGDVSDDEDLQFYLDGFIAAVTLDVTAEDDAHYYVAEDNVDA